MANPVFIKYTENLSEFRQFIPIYDNTQSAFHNEK